MGFRTKILRKRNEIEIAARSLPDRLRTACDGANQQNHHSDPDCGRLFLLRRLHGNLLRRLRLRQLWRRLLRRPVLLITSNAIQARPAVGRAWYHIDSDLSPRL